LESLADVRSHPKLGASWKGFVLEEILRVAGTRDAYFWATHAGAVLDVLILRHGRRYGFEIRYSDSPSMTKSLHIAFSDLGLTRAYIVYPGRDTYPIHDQVEVIAVSGIAEVFCESG
jgi:predicted AAA+ superfamily ATPase